MSDLPDPKVQDWVGNQRNWEWLKANFATLLARVADLEGGVIIPPPPPGGGTFGTGLFGGGTFGSL